MESSLGPADADGKRAEIINPNARVAGAWFRAGDDDGAGVVTREIKKARSGVDLKTDTEHARKDKGLFRGATRRERAGSLPRTSNIPSFVERAKKRQRGWRGREKEGRHIGRRRDANVFVRR